MTTPTRHPATLLVALATSALLLTGCSEEAPEPKFAETPTAEPTPVEQEETAEEFIRRWAQLQSEMQQSGDTEGYRQIAGRCEPCMVSADLIDDIYEAGGYVETEGTKVLSIEPEAESRKAETYLVDVEIAPTQYKEGADGAMQTLPGGRSTYSAVITRSTAGKWQFVHFVRVPE